MNRERKEKLLFDEFSAGLLENEIPEETAPGETELFGKAAEEKAKAEEKKEEPIGIDILDCGKNIRISEEAAAAFAKAAGKSVGEVIEIYQKGCCFDELMKRYKNSAKDSEAFNKIAAIRGIGKDELKNEILGVIEKAQFEKAVAQIEEENPGISKETAAELAAFRLEKRKPEAEKGETAEKEKRIAEKIREIDSFTEKHSAEGIKALDRSVVEEWEKGIPLEKAFYNFMLMQKNKKLLEEIENMKREKMMDDQKTYARAHSAGSVSSSAKNLKPDEFIEGLFKEY